MQNQDYVKVLGSVAAVIQALPAHELVSPVIVLVENSIGKLATALNGQSADEAREICLLQLASLTACAKNFSEPEAEILDLDGLAEATDEAEKARQIQADPKVEQLRSHLLEAIRALTTAFKGDSEVSQALSDFLKACTSTNLATPLSLDAVALTRITADLIEGDLSAIWLSIGALLLFRLGKKEISQEEFVTLQMSIGRVLVAATQGLQGPDGAYFTYASFFKGSDRFDFAYLAMVANPDVVQGFMDWSLAALTSFARILATLSAQVESLLLLSIRALDLQERVALQKTIQLLTAFVNQAVVEEQSANIYLPLLQVHGRSVLQLTLAGVGGRLPRSNLGYLAELLLAFSRRMPNETREWLKQLFAQEGFPSTRVSKEQKDRYAKNVMRCVSYQFGRTTMYEARKLILLVCR